MLTYLDSHTINWFTILASSSTYIFSKQINKQHRAVFFPWLCSANNIVHNTSFWLGCRYIFTTTGEATETLKSNVLIELNRIASHGKKTKPTKITDDELLEKRAPIHQPRNNICFDASNNDANNACKNKLKTIRTKKNQRIVDYGLFLLTFHRCLLPVLQTELLFSLSDKILLN